MRNILAVCALLASSVVFADNWQMLTGISNPTLTWYVDTASVHHSVVEQGHKVTSIEGKRVYSHTIRIDGMDYDTSLATLYIDCKTAEFTVGNPRYLLNGTLVRKDDGVARGFSDIPALTAVAETANLVCR